MAADPFVALRVPVVPLAPDPRFADQLRRRVQAALADRPEEDLVTATATAKAAPTDTAAPVRVARAVAVTPYLACRRADEAIRWYGEAFGATVVGEVIRDDDGRVGHAELRFGGSALYLSDEWPEIGVLGPESRGGPTSALSLDVDDADAAFERAVSAGAIVERPLADQPYGRGGWLVDPFGHRWNVLAQSGAELGGELWYFTLGGPDPAASSRFFTELFGWRVEGGSVAGGYNIASTRQAGGLYRSDEPIVTLFFSVPDIGVAVARVRELGGTADEPVRYDSGWNARCRDDQGVPFDLGEPAPGY